MPASARPFMGATPYSDATEAGATFRVWAKFANNVFVTGTFNAWSRSANPLFSEGNGYWSVDVPGAGVGDQYKFIIDTANPSWRMDPYARQIVHDAAGNLNGVMAASAEGFSTPNYSTPSWNELVIYEMHVRTFLYGGGYNGAGSFASAITKLNYLRDLGINAIELMPLGEFTGDISGGYNPAYIFAVEDEYGGPDGFRNFVNEAHSRGIAVIVDVVYNHLGDSAGDMWQFDGWSQNGKGAFTSTTTGRATQPGERPALTMDVAKFGSICATTPCAGWSSASPMACVGIQPDPSAMSTTRTTIRQMTSRMAGASCNGSIR